MVLLQDRVIRVVCELRVHHRHNFGYDLRGSVSFCFPPEWNSPGSSSLSSAVRCVSYPSTTCHPLEISLHLLGCLRQVQFQWLHFLQAPSVVVAKQKPDVCRLHNSTFMSPFVGASNDARVKPSLDERTDPFPHTFIVGTDLVSDWRSLLLRCTAKPACCTGAD